MACSTLYIIIPKSSSWFKIHPRVLPSCLSFLNMKITEVLYFDSHKYAVKISQLDYPHTKLQDNIYRKRRNIVSSTVSVLGGLACAYVTGGMSLGGTIYSGRNLKVQEGKLALLEAEWVRRGGDPLVKRYFKDTVMPLITSGAVCAFTLGADIGLAHAAAPACQCATQMAPPEDQFNGHLVSSMLTVAESGMSYVGRRVNTIMANPVRFLPFSFGTSMSLRNQYVEEYGIVKWKGVQFLMTSG